MNKTEEYLQDIINHIDFIIVQEENKTLKDAFLTLPEIDFVSQSHFNLGFYLRNKFFYSSNEDNELTNKPLISGDDFSAIICTFYYRHKYNIPYDFNEIIRSKSTMGWMMF